MKLRHSRCCGTRGSGLEAGLLCARRLLAWESSLTVPQFPLGPVTANPSPFPKAEGGGVTLCRSDTEQHSAHTCVTCVEQRRNVLPRRGRGVLSCTTAVAFTVACSWKGARTAAQQIHACK